MTKSAENFERWLDSIDDIPTPGFDDEEPEHEDYEEEPAGEAEYRRLLVEEASYLNGRR